MRRAFGSLKQIPIEGFYHLLGSQPQKIIRSEVFVLGHETRECGRFTSRWNEDEASSPVTKRSKVGTFAVDEMIKVIIIDLHRNILPFSNQHCPVNEHMHSQDMQM